MYISSYKNRVWRDIALFISFLGDHMRILQSNNAKTNNLLTFRVECLNVRE
jgi:hypothetical protein